MKKEFTYIIQKDMNPYVREVIQLPLTKHSTCKGIRCAVTMDDICRYMAYIIIADSGGQIRLQKLLGYGEQILAITDSSKSTTIGGVPGEIPAGDLTIVLGIFTEYMEQKLGQEQAKISITVTDEELVCSEAMGEHCFVDGKHGLVIDESMYSYEKIYSQEKRWFKGDFHTHTTLSDGKDTVRRAMHKANMQKMDFYVPTEHNLMHTGWCDTELLILPGIEITTAIGHFNIFGLRRQPSQLQTVMVSQDINEVQESCIAIMEEARALGSIVSINHPFLHIWKWIGGKTPLALIDCVEIVNDPTYDYALESNEKAIRLMDLLWEDGHKIYAVGGSDAHNLTEERYTAATEPSIIGDPGTYVYCENLTPNNLMRQIRAGHIIVTRYIELTTEITVEDKRYLPGDEITSLAKIEYALTIQKCKEEPKVYVVVNGKRTELLVTSEDREQYSTKISIDKTDEKWQWIRMEVRTKDGRFLGYTNPIYRGEKKCSFQTYEEARMALEVMDEN